MSLTQNLFPNASSSIQDAGKYIAGNSTVTLTPANSKGISGFVFDIPAGENVSLESDVTDHYTENGSFVNDHVVNKPIKITLRGFIGELVFKKEKGLAGLIRDLGTKLSQVTGYLGSYTPGFVQKAGQIITQTDVALNAINSTVQQSQNVVSYLSGNVTPNNSKQAEAYYKLEALRNSKTPVAVDTPWKFYGSMIIVSISFDQDDKSNDITDISVTLKEFRTVDLGAVSFNGALFKQPNEVQSSSPTDSGPIPGKPNNKTFLLDSTEKGLDFFKNFGGAN